MGSPGIILTEQLVSEHSLILELISVLVLAVQKFETGGNVSPEFFLQSADFIRNFADKFHHAKEENILFKKMVAKGMPEKDSPIEAMLLEHEQGREFVKGMVIAVESFAEGNESAKNEIIRNALGYSDLLKEHIEKEDNILYPLAERTFTESEKISQLKLFKKAEQERGGKLTIRKYSNLVKKLEKEINGVS
ncbi:MAG: hemerythrin domain-containing protein [archaeon]